MSWLEYSIQTDKGHAEQTELAMTNAGALSVTVTDAADQPILEPAPGDTPVWDDLIITGLFERPPLSQQTLMQLAQDAGLPSTDPINVTELAEQQWTRTWMDHFKPMSFGQRLWVCPHDMQAPDPDAINLRLDPGLAFGTGTHPTTELCLRWLDGHINHQQSLLDYGCGSGILAIAALLLGVPRAWAIDNDEQALIASRDNAANNHVADRITTLLPEQLAADATVDVCVANILAAPLMSLASHLANRVNTNGQIVLSGILVEQAEEVSKHYQPWFIMKEAVSKDGWVLLQGQRRVEPIVKHP